MNSNDTIAEVIENNLCIGCGSCAFAAKGKMQETKDGFYSPSLSPEKANSREIAEVCPFSNVSKNEDQISNQIFGETASRDPYIGTYQSLHAGHSSLAASRYSGVTSGGIITWLNHALLENETVDCIVHSKEDVDSEEFGFAFGWTDLSSSQDLAQKSKYYPTEMSRVMNEIANGNRTVAFVGLPCQVKAVRLLQERDERLQNNIKVCIGLICGHLKSKHYADYLASQCNGDRIEGFRSIDFRYREPGADMADYSVKIETDTGTKTKAMKEIFASGWQYNLFRNPACDYCDDVFSETADISVGDIWLDKYRQREQAHSLIVVRRPEFLQLLKRGVENEELSVESVSPGEAVRAQAGGLRDRRTYLSERLRANLVAGHVEVKKRVEPSRRKNSVIARKVELRAEIAAKSREAWHEAVKFQDPKLFKQKILPLKEELDGVEHTMSRNALLYIKKLVPKFAISLLFKIYARVTYILRP